MASMRSVLFRVADTVSSLRRILRDTQQNRRRNTWSADKMSLQHMLIEKV
jgi:heme exporter protein D